MIELFDSLGNPLPDIEAPSADRLRVYGDLAFLAFRSQRHIRMSVAGLRTYLEPAIEFGQYRIFRFDGVPRGMYTWAWLGPEAERRLITGEPLTRADWQSGSNLWIIDLIAPYSGLTAQIVRWIMVPDNFAEQDFFFRRVGGENETRRIVHIDFDAEKLARVYSGQEYLDMIG
ncbi:MAG: toxin-activating lysine-acyltransferase [Paracoccaceae bacterium]|jgi:cytolysin-activating lysine-acyltransferase